MASLRMRSARYVDTPATVTVKQGDRTILQFEKSPGGQRIQQFDVALEPGPLDLSIESSDPKLGVAIDWLSLEDAKLVLPWSEASGFVLPGAVLLGLVVAGFPLRVGVSASLALACTLAAFFWRDPFGFAHVVRDLGWPVSFFVIAIGALVRRMGMSPWTQAALVATYLLKGAFLFHPNYFYNDVRQNDRYVRALAENSGGLLERSTEAQVQLGVGYPRIIGGKKYAFPYSPLFYWPFTFLPQDRDIVVRAIKHVALLSGVAEVFLAAWLAKWWQSRSKTIPPAIEWSAAWLTFAFPILTNRMLYAMWSTLAGHALDLAVICAAAWWLDRPESRGRATVFFLSLVATFSIYVSSLFNASAFVLGFAWLAKDLRWKSIFAWLAAALLTVVSLYGAFTRTFLAEIVPTILRGEGNAAERQVQSSIAANFIGAFERVVSFGGFGFSLLALVGLTLLWRSRKEDDSSTIPLLSWAFAFLALLLLRGVSFGVFRDVKEIEFAAPLLAILSAFSILRLWPRFRAAAAMVFAGLLLFGVAEQCAAFDRWSALVMSGK